MSFLNTVLQLLIAVVIFSVFVSGVTFFTWWKKVTWWKKLLINTTPYATWMIIASFGIGAQSLSNLIELLFILCVHIITEIICWVFRFKYGSKVSRNIPLIISIVAAILLRIFMPLIPE